METKEMYLLQHGNYGEGPINPYMVSESSLELLKFVRKTVGNENIGAISSIFGSGGCIHISLTQDFEYNGFSYNMFFIDKIKSLE